MDISVQAAVEIAYTHIECDTDLLKSYQSLSERILQSQTL